MTRSTAREIAIQLSFAAAASGRAPAEIADDFFSEEHYATLAEENELFSERPNKKQLSYIRTLIALIEEHRYELDTYIERYAKGWRVERLSRTALAVLRCAICEILYMEDVPTAAAIDEAVELDKNYDEPETVAFVNGVLGAFVREELKEEADQASAPVTE